MLKHVYKKETLHFWRLRPVPFQDTGQVHARELLASDRPGRGHVTDRVV